MAQLPNSTRLDETWNDINFSLYLPKMILNFKGTVLVLRIGLFLFSSFTVHRDLTGAFWRNMNNFDKNVYKHGPGHSLS